MRTYLTVRGGRASEVAAEVVREQPLTIYVNGEKFLTLRCSPMMLDAASAKSDRDSPTSMSAATNRSWMLPSPVTTKR